MNNILSPDNAVIIDETLARLFVKNPNPTEKLSHDQRMALYLFSISGAFLTCRSGRLVQLECRHYKITRATKRTGCPRCGAMIRAGYDYDAFRNLEHLDTFNRVMDIIGNYVLNSLENGKD